ncbi:hypothetical protein [Streptomyces sp. NPDC097619]|uniref:hypothetical protein n=1 Tax=Streptomyces sp. NPDC097619 TaxID=3157228 RepID=UPI00331BB853
MTAGQDRTGRHTGSPDRGAARWRTAVGTAVALLVAGLLVGCEGAPTVIQGTDVVEAGEPAKVAPDRPDGILLYFVGEGGTLVPVLDRSPFGPDAEGLLTGGGAATEAPDRVYRVPIDHSIRRLLQGPSARERTAGLTSALPWQDRSPEIRVERAGSTLQLRMSLDVTALSATARGQLVCTAQRAETGTPSAEVVLIGPDGATEPTDCETG